MDRRQFIIGSCATGAVMMGGIYFYHRKNSSFVRPKLRNVVYSSTQNSLVQLDLIKNEVLMISTQLKAHSFIVHPKNTNIVTAVEKVGRKAQVVDFQNNQNLKFIEAPEGSYFYGHGIYSESGDHLYLNRLSADQKNGSLVVFETVNYEEVEVLKINHLGLHDMVGTSKLGIIAITKAGIPITFHNKVVYNIEAERESPAGIVLYDLNKKTEVQVLDSHTPNQSLSHLISLSNQDLIVLSSPSINKIESHETRRGALFFVSSSGQIEKFEFPINVQEKIRGELLSLGADEEKGNVFISCPEARLIFVVDYQQKKLIKTIEHLVLGIAISYDLQLAALTGPQSYLNQLDVLDLNTFEIRKLNLNSSGEQLNSPHLSIV